MVKILYYQKTKKVLVARTNCRENKKEMAKR